MRKGNTIICDECSCDNGTMVFDSETRTPLLRISNDNKMSAEGIYNELVKKRNKLNREISKLKKANQIDKAIEEMEGGGTCSEAEFNHWLKN